MVISFSEESARLTVTDIYSVDIPILCYISLKQVTLLKATGLSYEAKY